MRTALISDIHGNSEGLLAVLADIESQGCDRIFCLGDLVDGGAGSAEVVQCLRERAIPIVRGNHDEFPNEELSSEVADYVQSLPEDIVEGSILYTHTSPRHKKDKISTTIEAWNVFQETQYTRIFVGDVHVPLIYGERCPEKVSATVYEIAYDEERPLASDDRYIICVGAVGYSRDGWHRLRYAIYDNARDTILFRAPDGPILRF